MAQISTVLIPCWVVQMNNEQFIDGEVIQGKQLQVPCRNVLLDEWWGIPIKDSGIFTVIEFIPKEDNFQEPIDQPTFDSIPIIRVRDKFSGYTWWVYGTESDFVSSCETCCGDATVPMPGDNVFPITIAPCQEFCEITNVNGDFQAIFGLPTLGAGEVYFPIGSYNNVAFSDASTSGYASVSSLLSFLNSNWDNPSGASPSVTLVWTATSDELTLIATGGNDGDSICVSVIAITPSP